MIKTIKVKKQLRLDELIKHVRDNKINSQAFVSEVGRASVYFDSEQKMSFGEYAYGEMGIDRIFTVEEEEEITDYTVFDHLLEITKDGEQKDHGYNVSISDFENAETLRIYAVIDKKIELIREVGKDGKTSKDEN